MCFYDQHRFECGDWKWGHFRQHCTKEYRIGETCGIKLIMQTISAGQKCKLCDKIDTKMRRRAAEVDRINRWQREGSKFSSSINKSMEVIRGLDGEIYELGCERNRRLQGIGALATHAASDGSVSNGEPPIQSGDISNARHEENQARLAVDRPDSQSVDSISVRQPISRHDSLSTATLLNQAGKENPQHQKKTIEYRLVNKRNIFFGLPITFESISNPATVMAIPDTGADENIISLTLAITLGLELDMNKTNGKSLDMINKGVVRCCGLARAKCGFGTTSHLGPSGLPCTFRVSETTVSPLIMSYSFLMNTLTLSKYRHRLVSLAKSTLRLPCIRAFGQTRQRLPCSLNGEDIEAFPDSGSDIDVIAHDYAVQRRLLMEPTDAWVMFADGSIKKAVGICTGQLTVGSGIGIIPGNGNSATGEDSSERYNAEPLPSDDHPTLDMNKTIFPSGLRESNYCNVIYTQFYVLRDITVDLLLGTASLESLQVYTRHQDQFITKPPDDMDSASFSRIILLGKIGQFLRQAANKWFGNSQEFGFPAGSANVIPSLNQSSAYRYAGHDITFEQILGEADQRENARREAARVEASRMTGEVKLRFEEQERKKQDGYNEYRTVLQQVNFQAFLRNTSNTRGRRS